MDLCWLYRDAHGATQGPFPGLQMRKWHEAGYFSGSTCVAVSSSSDSKQQWHTIMSLWQRPDFDAFLLAPKVPAPAIAAAPAIAGSDAGASSKGKSSASPTPHEKRPREEEQLAANANKSKKKGDERTFRPGQPPDKVIKRKLIEREQHRYNKDWKKADAVKEELHQLGVQLVFGTEREGEWLCADGRVFTTPKLSFKTF